MNFLQVCVVRNEHGGIHYFEQHDPVPAGKGKLQMKLNVQEIVVDIQFCKRCGVAYIESLQRTFSKPANDSGVLNS